MPSFLVRKHQKFHRKNIRFYHHHLKCVNSKQFQQKVQFTKEWPLLSTNGTWYTTQVYVPTAFEVKMLTIQQGKIWMSVFSVVASESTAKKAATLCDPSCTHHQNKKGTVFMHSNHLSTDGGVEHDLVVFKNMISTLGTMRYYRRLLTREQHERFPYEVYWKLTTMVIAQVQNVLAHFEIQFLKLNSQQ